MCSRILSSTKLRKTNACMPRPTNHSLHILLFYNMHCCWHRLSQINSTAGALERSIEFNSVSKIICCAHLFSLVPESRVLESSIVMIMPYITHKHTPVCAIVIPCRMPFATHQTDLCHMSARYLGTPSVHEWDDPKLTLFQFNE